MTTRQCSTARAVILTAITSPHGVEPYALPCPVTITQSEALPAFGAAGCRGPTRAEAEAAKAAGDKRSDQEIAAEQARTQFGIVRSVLSRTILTHFQRCKSADLQDPE